MRKVVYQMSGGDRMRWVKCTTCKGTGKIEPRRGGSIDCENCNGYGGYWVEEEGDRPEVKG